LLECLFRQDYRFIVLTTGGLPAAVTDAMSGFWTRPAYRELGAALGLVPADAGALVGTLESLAAGQARAGDANLWREVAEASARLTEEEPVAGSLVALQALAAWVGALGEQLFYQPWTGHHPGWHVFPLVAARNLVAAEAIWGARFLCETAAGFIESARDAPLDPDLVGVVAEYERVRAAADRIEDNCIAELAWALHAGAANRDGGFRAELAALFWTAGDVVHADLLTPVGTAHYVPSLGLVRALVDHCLRVLPREPLLQYIWLEMKDRGPFDLRGHKILFGRINNRFHDHPLHEVEDLFPVGLCRPYARLLIGVMRGRPDPADREALFDAMAVLAELVEGRAPDAYLRIAALANRLGLKEAAATAGQWRGLAATSASILRWADRTGIYDPFGRALDIPFHFLAVDTEAALEAGLDLIEAYRQANLGYWLAISPPFPPPELPSALDERHEKLLQELRGARFIRLLPHLPQHYRRYGYRLDEALKGPPVGSRPADDASGALQFDPFDQNRAIALMQESWGALEALYAEMGEGAPAYAETLARPPSSADDLVAALAAHRPRAPQP